MGSFGTWWRQWRIQGGRRLFPLLTRCILKQVKILHENALFLPKNKKKSEEKPDLSAPYSKLLDPPLDDGNARWRQTTTMRRKNSREKTQRRRKTTTRRVTTTTRKDVWRRTTSDARQHSYDEETKRRRRSDARYNARRRRTMTSRDDERQRVMTTIGPTILSAATSYYCKSNGNQIYQLAHLPTYDFNSNNMHTFNNVRATKHGV